MNTGLTALRAAAKCNLQAQSLKYGGGAGNRTQVRARS